jgi:FolB domain-containing protein
MRFHTRIGVLPHEAEFPQPLEVDLTVFRGRRDSARAPALLDYRVLYDLVAKTVGTGQLLYLEDVAEAIAGSALGADGVERVRVAVRKPHVALPGPLDAAEIVIERERRE